MKKYFSIITVFILLFAACSKDDDGGNTDFDGSMQDIKEFVGSELLDTIVDMGMVINPGNKPPNIEGKYLMSPTILENSNVPSDYPGMIFNDLLLEFSRQNGLEIEFTGEQVSSSSVGKGSFISGSGKDFSVFLNAITVREGQPNEMEQIFVFSGTVATEGIHDLQLAFFMVENNGNSGVIDNGQGRIFMDGDGFSERQPAGLQKPSTGEKMELSAQLQK